jgi:hypothetical protein
VLRKDGKRRLRESRRDDSAEHCKVDGSRSDDWRRGGDAVKPDAVQAGSAVEDRAAPSVSVQVRRYRSVAYAGAASGSMSYVRSTIVDGGMRPRWLGGLRDLR